MKIFKKRQGFTLIELVVVLAVLAILVTLVLGAILISRKMSKNTKYRVDVKTVRQGIEAYRISNKKYPLCDTCNGGAGAGYGRINAYDFFKSDLTKSNTQAAGDLIPHAGVDAISGPADRICYSTYNGATADDYWLWIITEEESNNHVCRCPNPNPSGLLCGYGSAADGSKIHCPKKVADDPELSVQNGCFQQNTY